MGLNMENVLIKLLYLVGASVCHQLPERSYFAGPFKIPVCARCEGIYIGFFITAIILFIMFRKKESDLAPLYVLAVAALFVLSTVVDGSLSYFFGFSTNNILRFSTGYLAGSAAMTIIYPVFNYQYYSCPAAIKIFSRPWQFIVFIIISVFFIIAGILDIKAVNIALLYLSAFSVIFTFYFINIVLLLLIPAFSQKAKRLFSKYILLPTLAALFLAGLELYISYRLHMYMALLTAK
ncbi:MAG: DUF2085 domain-containing protein [Actinobacteria bacterium]|nr:DUF2085 domain-containing protein [Actinomycetota bacterium]